MASLKAAILKVQSNLAQKEQTLKVLTDERPRTATKRTPSLVSLASKFKRKP